MVFEVVKKLFVGDPGDPVDSRRNYMEWFLKKFGALSMQRSENITAKTVTDASTSQNKSKHMVHFMSKQEFLKPIEDEYAKSLSQLPPEEIYDNYNPGPTKPDGSVNFECHCVAHLVGSPCGFHFRKAITCQKSSTDEEMEKGACADEFMEFMNCAIKTQCFRLRDDKDSSDEKLGV